jgi:Tol biopolymer transport system component
MQKHRTRARWWVTALVGIVGSLGLVSCGGAEPENAAPNESPAIRPAGADVSNAAGRIVFMRGDPSEEAGASYTVDPDGSDERPLVPEFPNSEYPSWSPDGTEIHVFCCGDGMVAHFVDPDTGELLRALPPLDPAVELFCGGAWSPDGRRIACEGYGAKDPGLSGIYSVRASDGGGLQRITSNAEGWDIPGDYSPDGERLVFARWVDDEPVGFFVTELDGSDPVQISPPDLLADDAGFAGSWSPDGEQILFVVRESQDHHKSIWVVNADGRSPRPLWIDEACGGSLSDAEAVGCYSPAWSPDGSQIVFTRSSPDASVAIGYLENIYIVNADGTGLVQVTDGGFDDNPDWGTSPPNT